MRRHTGQRRAHLTEICATIGQRRRADRNHRHVRSVHRYDGIATELQRALLDDAPQELLKHGLVDGRALLAQLRQAFLVDVVQPDLDAAVGEPDGCHQADVPGTDNANRARSSAVVGDGC